ncbi:MULTISPECIES: efflux RND transporter periplasmic adaptor subunit [Sphingobacterium]|nr:MULTISPECIES: efflux RND transporter periplasmic adaptor subunit [Sphingobacterium]KKX48479.1 hemolysin D [Sphingobacterium sp. IITKGP-BTPF85]QQT43513.1 efflux RND transporter periplasmic adaptor subunit [Sphingobacterium multivorum]SUI97995.1 Cation efflux system protein CzcB [Sphingobacterium multivorum]
MYSFNIKNKSLGKLKMLFPTLGILLLVQCQNKPEEAVKQAVVNESNTVVLTDAQLKNAAVETVRLSEKNIASVLKLNGKIDVPPQNLISVNVLLGGFLKSTRLLPGMYVRKGETIAVMEDPQYIKLQQDYLQAKSKLHFAQLDYQRQKDLNQSQASSDKVMQTAQAEMNNQQIMMNALAQQLRLININPNSLSADKITKTIPVYSAINGFVSKVNVNIGKYVNPSDVLFELVNPNDLHLNLKVYENDLDKLKIGQKLLAYSNAEPDKKYQGEIILISRNVGDGGISEVHCHFESPSVSLSPGMYMNAEIEAKTTFAHAVPEESVVNFEGKDYVFVQTAKQTYKMLPVTVGAKENGFVQIVNADDFTGKNIVSKNAYTLLMKLKNTEDEE